MNINFYINGKNYVIDSDRHYIGEGSEGTVYNFNNQALKIYKEQRNNYFNKPSIKKLEYLSKINTNHFVFPTNIVTDKNGNLIGHVSPYIKNNIDIEELRNKNISDVIKELKSIRKDVLTISTHNIILSGGDFYRNYIYDGKINFIDFDLYTFFLEKQNNKIWNQYITEINNLIINHFFILNLLVDKFKYDEFVRINKKLIANNFSELYHLDMTYFEDFLEIQCKNKNLNNINDFIKVYKHDLLMKK